MQALSFNLNPNNAKQVGTPGRIQDKGAYTGTFVRVEAVTSQKGTQGIEFAFKSSDGQTADYLTVWAVDKDGKELYGRKVIDALMTCLRVKAIQPKTAQVKKYDQAAKAEVLTQATVYPELMNKPIGVLLVREEYAKNDGSIGTKMTLVGAYEPNQRLTPREVLEQSGPGQLEKVIASLQDRPLRQGNRPSATTSAARDGGGGFDDMADDIPF